MLFNAFVLALSASIDSLGVGITYGLKKTKINVSAFLVLFILSITFTSVSILLGHLITSLISNFFVSLLGALILFFIGVFIILGATINNKKTSEAENNYNENDINISKEYNFFIKCLGITINIIKDPVNSDIDRSNKIDIKEAIFLGVTLSLDSIGIGFGGSTIGVNSFIFPLLISIFQIIFLSFGSLIGKKISNASKIPSKMWNIISGVLLICIGIIKIISLY